MGYLRIAQADAGYCLTGKVSAVTKSFIRETYGEDQLTDLFNRVVELNTSFTAVSKIVAQWIFKGYPMELLALQVVKKDPGFAHTVLENLYRVPRAMKDARVRIYDNGVFVTKCANVPGVYRIPFADSYEMYSGNSLADLEFAGTTFATAAEAQEFIARADSLKKAGNPAEQAAVDWLQQYSAEEPYDERHEQRKAFLNLKDEGIYLLSTESDWFYAPDIDKETLISKLKSVCKGTSSSEAGKTSVFG